MKPRKSLHLKKETLAELTSSELRAVAGAGESGSCPITYTCVSCNGCNISDCDTFTCITNGCTIGDVSGICGC